MSKLSIKKLKRKNLPYGKFKYKVLFKRFYRSTYSEPSNSTAIHAIRIMLDNANERFKLVYDKNRAGKKVYTALYLTNPMMLAMIKLAHHERLFKIYQIVVEPTLLSHEDNDQTGS